MNNARIFEEYIRPYSNGSSLHFSILQPNLQYFTHEFGLITYTIKFGQTLVLGDPIFTTAKDFNRIQFLKCFIDSNPNIGFVQCSKNFAELLNENFGYYGTRIGTERLIDLQEWSLKGKCKQTIRTACNQARKKGIIIRESKYEENFRAVSDKWLSTRTVNSKEISFLVRKFPYFEIETRKFCAYSNQELIAFIIFDPIYENSECIGYIPNVSRSSEKFRQGAFYAIMVEAINCFKNEGKKIINLGLSPLHITGSSKPFESKLFLWILSCVKNFTPKLYNYNGIEYTKSRFFDTRLTPKDDSTNSMYLCHHSKLPIIKLLAIFRASNVI